MKKLLIILASFIFIIVLGLFLGPILFKDQIKAAIDKELDSSVNADIYFEPDNFSLTFFRNFPNVTATLEEFGVINRAPFAGEILFATRRLDVEVNLASVLFEDQLRIKGITLVQPEINVLVLEDGSANYDIAITDTTTSVETDTVTSGNVSFGIDHWEIVDGHVVYDDASIPYRMDLKGINHTGSGDFTLSVFDMDLQLQVDSVDIIYDGVEYVSDKRFTSEMTLNMDLDQYKFAFRDNTNKINDFGLSFEGWFAMPEEGYDMDLSFSTADNSFKSLLSLIPGVYGEGFEDLEAQGSVSFSGTLKGMYTEETMPAYTFDLEVKEGMFRYPELPEAVEEVNIAMKVASEDGDIDKTTVDISAFDFRLGNNPFSGSVQIGNLVNFPLKASLDATLDLASINRMFPVEGAELRGLFTLNAKAEGTYDSVRQIIPAIDLTMMLEDGYAKSEEFPVAIESIHIDSKVRNESGRMEETYIDLNDFSFMIGEDKFSGNFHVKDLSDYQWQGNLNGKIDLEKMLQIFPQEGMDLTGTILAEISTQGRYSDVEAERYDRLNTGGRIEVRDLSYTDEELLPYGMNIDNAVASFSPRAAAIEQYTGSIGRSDVNLKGQVTDYMAYLFQENGKIRGNLNFESKLLDLNEMMAAYESGEEEAVEDTTALEVIPVPENIDFVLDASIQQLVYDNMNMSNAKGQIIVRNGVINLNGLDFDMLGGHFNVAGSYHTKDPSKPFYDFQLDVEDVSISQSFSTFGTVQKLAPIAEKMAGNISTDFAISGNLGEDMMPLYETLTGAGLLKVVQASLQDSKLLSGLSQVTSLKEGTNTATLKDVVMSAEITNGRLSVKPFDLRLGNYQSKVAGSIGLDGSLNYVMDMEVPAGQLGTQYNSLVSSLTGEQKESQNVDLVVGLGGSYNDPKFKVETAQIKEELKSAVTSAAQETAKQEGEKLLQSFLSKDTTATDSTAIASPDSLEQKVDEVKDAATEATEKLKNLFKRKKN